MAKKSKKPTKTVPVTPAWTPAAREAQATHNAQQFVDKNFDALFKIDTVGKGLPVKAAKAPPTQDPLAVKTQRKKIEKLRKHVLPKLSAQAVQPKPASGLLALDNTVDVWETNPIEARPKPQLKSSVPIVNPAVLPPVSGQSYNPRLDDHLTLIKERVEAETIKKPVNEEERKKRVARKLQMTDRQIREAMKAKRLEKLGKNGKAHYLEALKAREEKALVNQEKQFDQLVSAHENRIRQQSARLQATYNKHAKIAEQITTGKVRVSRLANSRHNLPETKTGDFVLPADLPRNLKDTAAAVSDAVRERFDSIYRRGLIEYKPIGKAQRMAKYKLHNKAEGHNVFIDGEK